MGTYALADKTSDVLTLINQERKAAGLKNVSLSDELNRVAQLRAAEIVDAWSHTRPNGEEWKTAFADTGVTASYRGENLAKGQYSAEMVVGDWMASQGHKENILDKKFTKMGVASVVVDGVTYWVQVFANDVKTTKKATSKSSTPASVKPAAQPKAAAAAPAPKSTAKEASSEEGRPSYNQTGALDKISRSVDLEAAVKAPAAALTQGKNPGL